MMPGAETEQANKPRSEEIVLFNRFSDNEQDSSPCEANNWQWTSHIEILQVLIIYVTIYVI